jgi:hypothetical protein
MPSAAYQSWIAAAVPNAPLTVADGGPQLELADGRATSTVRATLVFTTGSQVITVVIDNTASGTYRVDGGDVLAISYDTRQGGVVSATVDVGGVAQTIPGFEPPGVPDLAGGPFTCTERQLSIDALVPSGTVTTTYDRVV